MNTAGIYPVGASGLRLSDDEAALVATLSSKSRPATHAELHAAIVGLARHKSYTLELEMVGTGFMAVIARDLRVVANVRGRDEETFYCQAASSDMLRELAQEIARTCGPQIVLPSNGDDGILVVAPS
jgi:hypothetical protein